jgi:hypothetical protein
MNREEGGDAEGSGVHFDMEGTCDIGEVVVGTPLVSLGLAPVASYLRAGQVKRMMRQFEVQI